MIELFLYEYLKEALPVACFMEFPQDDLDRFVLIERTGGGQEDQLKRATLAFQSYAPSLYEAAQLNEQVKLALFNSIALDQVVKVSLNADYNFTDTEIKKYRYQAVFDFIYY